VRRFDGRFLRPHKNHPDLGDRHPDLIRVGRLRGWHFVRRQVTDCRQRAFASHAFCEFGVVVGASLRVAQHVARMVEEAQGFLNIGVSCPGLGVVAADEPPQRSLDFRIGRRLRKSQRFVKGRFHRQAVKFCCAR
jgi:hypothetical protein